MTALKKVHMRRCAAAFVMAVSAKVRLIPQELRTLPLALFTKPSKVEHRDAFFRGHEI
jgi:hypothetical protein